RFRGRRQHRKYRRVGMIELDGADRRVTAQVVFVRGKIPMPGDNVQRRMLELRTPERPKRFNVKRRGDILILISRDRRKKIDLAGKEFRADRPPLGKGERTAIIFANIAAGTVIDKLEPEFHSPWDDGDLARLNLDNSELRCETQAAVL